MWFLMLIVTFFGLCSVASAAGSTSTSVVFGTGTPLGAITTCAPSGSEDCEVGLFPYNLMIKNGTLSNLCLRFGEVDGGGQPEPGFGNAVTATLMLNGNPTILRITLADSQAAGCNTVDRVLVQSLDNLSVRLDVSGSPPVERLSWGFVIGP